MTLPPHSPSFPPPGTSPTPTPWNEHAHTTVVRRAPLLPRDLSQTAEAPVPARPLAAREELKRRFRSGALPSERDFAALIDAFVHQDDLRDWAERGTLEVGDPRDPRWTLSCEAQGELVVKPRAGAPAGALLQVRRWLATPGRVGTFPSGQLIDGMLDTPSTVDDDVRPPGVQTRRNGDEWVPVVSGVDVPIAFELVARVHRPDVDADRGRLWRRLGFGVPVGGLVHAIATSSGSGEPPGLTVTTAPARAARAWWARGATAATLLSAVLVVYAAFSFPAASCPLPWGPSCLSALARDRGALTVNATVLLLAALGIWALLLATRNRTLQVSWQRGAGMTYDLAVRAPSSTKSTIEFHLTRLW